MWTLMSTASLSFIRSAKAAGSRRANAWVARAGSFPLAVVAFFSPPEPTREARAPNMTAATHLQRIRILPLGATVEAPPGFLPGSDRPAPAEDVVHVVHPPLSDRARKASTRWRCSGSVKHSLSAARAK